MPDDEPTSIAQAIYLGDLAAFEATFEAFLASPRTPVQARRQAASNTIDRLTAILNRLRGQGAL